MGKKRTKKTPEARAERPPRVKLTEEESLRRMAEFDGRKEKIIAAVRKGKNRGLSA